ncbi:outer membrane lipoprotein chaperone LolA [Uliginosibacterium sp. H1]|uniref:outer membrane lipoprotein chaperone LolA n=1 Tax=Uliginosibacterium sp. H1 TaxID=3114757 RepID=UPI002E192859|nr:outer membrane lipoprotein chaperone LolA [Uliginosibacterium sp. H1]
MRKTLLTLIAAAVPALMSPGSMAASLDQLKQFLTETRTARASFSQVVTTKSGRPGQSASGTMLISRPGKFRWEYIKPYNQLIVGDGARLWSYDKDLNQVVVKPMGDSLGASPAALLAGDNALERNFTLKNDGADGELEWLEALPKTQEAGFQRVRIGFKGGLPQAMEVQDNFGQLTQLRFEKFERNPSLGADLFRFVPPKGADVVGE